MEYYLIEMFFKCLSPYLVNGLLMVNCLWIIDIALVFNRARIENSQIVVKSIGVSTDINGCAFLVIEEICAYDTPAQ